jgi:hypothetical protein
VLIHVVPRGWRSIEGRPLRRERAGLFRRTLRVLTPAGRIDRGATSSGKSVGAARVRKRAALPQPAGRRLRPESKMTI